MRAAAALLLGACSASASDGAAELTSKNFDAEVFESGKNALVKFLAPWCGHCKSMKPAWDELGKEYEGSANVIIADVDCTADDGKDVCEKHGVSGYPTIKYWTKDSREAKDYNGGRDLDELKEFVEENLAGPDPFTTLTSVDEFKDWAAADGALVLGLFRTPTVGALYTGWKGASRKLKDAGKFGVYAQSSYDAAAKKYTKSPLEEQLKANAPGVYISTDKGTTWAKCVVPSRTSTTPKERIDAISGCIKGEGLKPVKK